MKFPTPKNLYKGLSKEFRRIRWIDQEILWPLTLVVIGFIFAFSLYFMSIDGIINFLLELFKVVN